VSFFSLLIQIESKDAIHIHKGILIMAASFLPSILVPTVGLVFPAVAMAFLFLYIEREAS
jgi:photosystem I subunit VIII